MFTDRRELRVSNYSPLFPVKTITGINNSLYINHLYYIPGYVVVLCQLFGPALEIDTGAGGGSP